RLQLAAPGGSRSGHCFDREPEGLRKVEILGEISRDLKPGHAAPEGAPLQHQLAGHVRAHHESEPLVPARLGDDVAHDADHLSAHAEHGPARVPLVDGGVGLDELGQRHFAVDGVRLVSAADVPHGQRVREAVGRPDHEDLLADLTALESPRTAGAIPEGTRSSWSTARSALTSDAMTRAATLSPPGSSTAMSSAIC